MMDRETLLEIDERLDSSEVAALCFLCQDVVKRKRLDGVSVTYSVVLPLDLSCHLSNFHFLSLSQTYL